MKELAAMCREGAVLLRDLAEHLTRIQVDGVFRQGEHVSLGPLREHDAPGLLIWRANDPGASS